MATNILLFLLGLSIAQVQVAAASQLEPTRRLASLAQAPETTSKPKVPRRLLDRQAAVNTCGYFDEDPTQPYTCAGGQDCVSNTDWNIFGCCATDTAGYPITASCSAVADPYTSCVEYQSAAACVGACYTYNRVCPSSLPYCAIAYSYVGVQTYSEWFCQDVASGTPSLSVYAFATSASAGITTPSDTSTTPDIFVTSTIVTTSTASSDTTPITTTSPSQTTSETTPPSSPNAVSSGSNQPTVVPESKSHAGAIAGGVVGGLAVLGLIVGGVIYFLHRAKKQERKGALAEVSQI